MTVSVELREMVRRRARGACEFCGVTETDSGGFLTVDHFQPRAHGGTDTVDNLLYCCPNCNQYKAAYWPEQPTDPVLWNPGREPREAHLLALKDGTLFPLTPTGGFTLKRLRLNRPPLVSYRYRRHLQTEEQSLLTRYREVLSLLEQLRRRQAALLVEQRALLAEQRMVLNLLLKRQP